MIWARPRRGMILDLQAGSLPATARSQAERRAVMHGSGDPAMSNAQGRSLGPQWCTVREHDVAGAEGDASKNTGGASDGESPRI